MTKGLGCLVALVVVALVLGLMLMGSYNSLVGLRQATDAQWANVESAYQRRGSIPNLVTWRARRTSRSRPGSHRQRPAGVGQIQAGPEITEQSRGQG